MSTSPTVTGPGAIQNAQLQAATVFKPFLDKLRWRKNVLSWAQIIPACVHGGDSRSKRLLIALCTILFHSLLRLSQQLVEKEMECGNLIFDSVNPGYLFERLDTVEAIINIIARDSTLDAIRRLARLRKVATSCFDRCGGSIGLYVEHFLLPTQTCLNMVNANSQSEKSQKFTMILLSNRNLSHRIISFVMSSLVSVTKTCIASGKERVFFDKEKMKKVISVPRQLDVSTPIFSSILDSKSIFAKESAIILDMVLQRREIAKYDSVLVSFIHLNDATGALEKISIEQNETERSQTE